MQKVMQLLELSAGSSLHLTETEMTTMTMVMETTTHNSLLQRLVSTLRQKQPTGILLTKTIGDNKASAERAMNKVVPRLVTENLPADWLNWDEFLVHHSLPLVSS